MLDRITLFAASQPRPKGRPRHVKGQAKPYSTPKGSNEDLWTSVVARAFQGVQARLSGADRPGWLNEPLNVDCYFVFGTSNKARHGHAHTARPDRDNIDKLVLDQMQKSGLVGDDSRAASGRISKIWGVSGGVFVVIRPWTPEDAVLPELDDDDLGVTLPS